MRSPIILFDRFGEARLCEISDLANPRLHRDGVRFVVELALADVLDVVEEHLHRHAEHGADLLRLWMVPQELFSFLDFFVSHHERRTFANGGPTTLCGASRSSAPF